MYVLLLILSSLGVLVSLLLVVLHFDRLSDGEAKVFIETPQ